MAVDNGHRAGVSGRVKKMMLDAGYAIVSIDYRLAPETQLPAIIEDLEDAFRWVREQGPKLFQVDASKIAVTGGSAGGYLTLTSGFRVKPRPTVLVAFWGYGDLVGDWYSKPSKHARHQRVKLTKEEAYRQVSGPPVSDSRDRKGNGGAFYQYCRQQGLWPKAVSGWDPHTETKKFNPYMPVKNVTSDYPPTLLIHGTKDTDVPYEQSVMMAKQLKQHGVEHQLVTIPGGEHGLGGGGRSQFRPTVLNSHEIRRLPPFVGKLGSVRALTKGVTDWRESESSRPETGRRVQSRRTGAVAPNAQGTGLIAKNAKTLQPRAQNAKCREQKLSAFALTKEYWLSGVSYKGRGRIRCFRELS